MKKHKLHNIQKKELYQRKQNTKQKSCCATKASSWYFLPMSMQATRAPFKLRTSFLTPDISSEQENSAFTRSTDYLSLVGAISAILKTHALPINKLHSTQKWHPTWKT